MDDQQLVAIIFFFRPSQSCVLKLTKEGRAELVYTQQM